MNYYNQQQNNYNQEYVEEEEEEFDRNQHLDILFNEFLLGIVKNWTQDLVYQKETIRDHIFMVDRPFFENFARTFELEAKRSESTQQLVELFLNLLPYPETANGKKRKIQELPLSQLIYQIEDRFPMAPIWKSTNENEKHSNHPCYSIIDYIVSKISLEQDEAVEDFDDYSDDEDYKRHQNPNRQRTYYLPVDGSTITWIMSVVRINLENQTARHHKTPLLDEYENRSTLEWAKVMGIVSATDHNSKVQLVFKNLIESCKQLNQLSESSSIYFTTMRYLHVDVKTQERWLDFHLQYLRLYTNNKKISDEVLTTHMRTMINAFRQMDFIGRNINKVKQLDEIYDIVKKLAQLKKGSKVKRTCYQLMLALLLRSPANMFLKFNSFLEKRILQHLDDSNKQENCLDMLITTLQGTNNPFPFHEKRCINWLTKVRKDDHDNDNRDRMKLLFKHLTKNKIIESLYNNYWEKLVRVFVHLFAQDLEFSFDKLLPKLFNVKNNNHLQLILGLDVLSELMRQDGDFIRQHKMSEELINKANDFLPKVLWHCESNIGITKVGYRKSPLTLSGKKLNLRRLNLFTTDNTNLWVFGNKDDEKDDEKFDDNGTNLFNTNNSQQEKKEEKLLNNPSYVHLKNSQLLINSFVNNDTLAKTVLNIRQKQQNIISLNESIKLNKANKYKNLLIVLRGCIRCTLSLRPGLVLLDSKQGNKLYIGNYLLHPDYDLSELVMSVLEEIVSQEIVLLSKIITSLTNYLLQFYINYSECISVIIQCLAKLVNIFSNLSPKEKSKIVCQRNLVEDICISLHRLDAVAFAFLCHTDIYVRHGCVELVKSVENAMRHLIGYYFADKPPEQQQKQLSFPSSLGQLFTLYSDNILYRASSKFRDHQDNIKLTISPFESSYIDNYIKSSYKNNKGFGVLRALLDPTSVNTPFSACMDAIVVQIEELCQEGSEYMKFLRVDCCQEILLQPKWLSVDEKSTERTVLGSMCIALIPLMGFSENSLDNIEFYNSIWVQLWRFSKENDSQLLNTVLYAVQAAHWTRIPNLFNSLRLWYKTNYQQPKEKMKKKRIRQIFFANCRRLWVYHYVVLALSYKERLYTVFKDEFLELMDEESPERQQYLHNELIKFCNALDGKHLLQHSNGDPEVFRCVARVIENTAVTLCRIRDELKLPWIAELWDSKDRARLLNIMKIWSHCSTDDGIGKDLIGEIFKRKKSSRDKTSENDNERAIRVRILQLEYQSFRGATALLGIGQSLTPDLILSNNQIVNPNDLNMTPTSNKKDNKNNDNNSNIDINSDINSIPDEKKEDDDRNLQYSHVNSSRSWFQWAVEGQKEGIPSLTYLMRNHYALILKAVLTMLYSELSHGAIGNARIFFDVITSLDLPDSIDPSFNIMDVTQSLAVFCLSHLIPFIPKKLLKSGKKISQHRRDVSSLLTLTGIPFDNYGSTYALSLPVSLTYKQINKFREPVDEGVKFINRPIFLSSSMEYKQLLGTGQNYLNEKESKLMVQTIDDSMHAINMSRKAFNLFYKLGQKLGYNEEVLDKLHELRVGLQSNDLRDIKNAALQISMVFASTCSSDITQDIVLEIMDTLEDMTHRMAEIEENDYEIINDNLSDDQMTLASNMLEISLPWFANSPLHSYNDPEDFLKRLLNLTLKFGHESRPEIDKQFFRIWHAVLTSNTTLMSNPEPSNINDTIKFLIRTVIGRYEGYRRELMNIESMEAEARQYEINKQEEENNRKKRSKSLFKSKKNKNKNKNNEDDEEPPTMHEVLNMRKSILRPEQFIHLCVNVLRQIYMTHPESTLASLLQILNIGCGLGGHVLENKYYIQIKTTNNNSNMNNNDENNNNINNNSNDDSYYEDPSYDLGGEEYSLLVTEIALRWISSLSCRNMHRIRPCIPILAIHSLLFLNRTVEVLSNPCAELLSHLFVNLLPPRIGIDDEVVQIAIWLRDRRTYQFQWSDDDIFDIEPTKNESVYTNLRGVFENPNENKLNLHSQFARKHIIYVDDLLRLLYNCYRIRYGEKESIYWGIRALQWATVQVDPEEDSCVFKARLFACKALRLFSIIASPRNLRSVSMILYAVLTGLKSSQASWNLKPKDQHYMKEDTHLLLAIRGIEALTVLVKTKDWNRTLFRMMLVSFWISLSLLQCRVAKIQVVARRLLRSILEHKKWIIYLFGHNKKANGTKIKKESVSLQMFWGFFNLFKHQFNGIQQRLLSGCIFTVGEGSPLSINEDVMMILTCCWLIRCDVLHDKALKSRLAANICFFLPYACSILHPQFFSQILIDSHDKNSNHKKKRSSFIDNGIFPALGEEQGLFDVQDDYDDIDSNDGDIDSSEMAQILRKRSQKSKKCRDLNSRIFTLLGLYMEQNIISDESNDKNKNNEAINLNNIDFENQNNLLKYPMPPWSKINKNFRAIWVAIYDVIIHISNTVKSCLTIDEPSTKQALGDFCQALIDLFVPTQVATLASVFSICLVTGNEYMQLGTITALKLFTIRLFKQCKEMNVFIDIISCFDDTFTQCVALASSDIESVANSAHEFLLLLTKLEYKSLNNYQNLNSQKKFENSKYSPFRNYDPHNDGMTDCISSLTKVLNQTNAILKQFPDEYRLDSKLERLLKMEPKDKRLDPMMTVNIMGRQSTRGIRRVSSNDSNNGINIPINNRQHYGNQSSMVSSIGGTHFNQQASYAKQNKLGVTHILSREESNVSDYSGSLKNFKTDNMPVTPIITGNKEPKIKQKVNRNNNNQKNNIKKNKNKNIQDDEKNNYTFSPKRMSRQNSQENQTDPKHEIKALKMVRKRLSEQNKHKRDITFGPEQLQKMQLEELPDTREDDEEIDVYDEKKLVNDNIPSAPLMRMTSNENSMVIDEDGDLSMKGVLTNRANKLIEEDKKSFANEVRKQKQQQLQYEQNNNNNNNNNNMHVMITQPKQQNYENEQLVNNNNITPGNDININNNLNPGTNTPNQNKNYEPVSSSDSDNTSLNKKTNSFNNNKYDNIPIGIHNSNVPIGDLSTFLSDNSLLRVLLKYLKKKTNDYKLLEFYLMAKQFLEVSKDDTCTPKEQREHAKRIIETFFLPDSKKFLDVIQGMTRHEAMKLFVSTKKNVRLSQDLFERSKQEVKNEMISRIFPLFMQSQRYNKLVEDGKIRPP